MGSLLGGLFVAAVAAVVLYKRRDLAHAQALVLGGSIRPGCVIAEAIGLLLIAAAIILARLI
jgi:hypothetical protein